MGIKINRSKLIVDISDNCNNIIISKIIDLLSKPEIYGLSDKEIKKLSNRLLNSKLSFNITDLIYNTTEQKVRELLSKANEEQNVTIKLFKGISLESKFVSERKKKNNFTGEIVVYPQYIKPKANFSRGYIKNLSNL